MRRGEGLDKAREVLDRDKLPPEERSAYDYLQTQRSHDLSMIASSKLEGKVEGHAEGEAIGLQKGLEKGREEGREEREKLAKELEAALAELARLKT